MLHLNEAYDLAEDCLIEWIENKPRNWRVLVVKDVLATIRVILWCSKDQWEPSSNEIDRKLSETCADYWSKTVLPARLGRHPANAWQEDAWRQARRHGRTDKLRVLEKHLTKSGWFEAPSNPPWKTSDRDASIVLFYSFKGGVGRSTALAASALHLASVGDRVAVIDADLDAPSIGSLLAGHDRSTAQWGVVDYLLERNVLKETELPTEDYHHRFVAPSGVGGEDVFVYPAGTFDGAYVDKLARIDYGNPVAGTLHPFVALLQQIRRELAPRWILVDSRAGLGEVSGFLTGGLCHLHVLLGTLAEASWRGLELILERLGGDRIREGKAQAECLLAASMVPRSDESLFQTLVSRFTERARDAFSAHYYAEPGEAPDELWTLSDLESDDAPHVPVVLPYEERLATFRDLSDVAEGVLLREGPYRDLAGRLRSSLSL